MLPVLASTGILRLGRTYTPDFFATISTFSEDSAKVVFDVLFDLYRPNSLLDVGCGVGAWLAEAAGRGIEVHGVDGEWVTQEQLRIPAASFRSADLTEPLDLARRFDMAMTLEVAEHLPHNAADTFIDTLTRHADVVLFSAAVPNQSGNHHINEQWPQYWQAKFQAREYELFDVLRGRLWDDERVAWWYRQNLLLYATGEAADKIRAAAPVASAPLAVVHPAAVRPGLFPQPGGVLRQGELFASALVRAARRRLGR